MSKNIKIFLLCFILLLTGAVVKGLCNTGTSFRIVSLSPVITEWLYLLGLENNVIGVTTYCNKPPRVKDKEKIGTVVDINAEKIISLRPDILFAMSLTNDKDLKKLKSMGINLISYDIPKDFEKLCEVSHAIGKAVGKEKEAVVLIKSSKMKVSEIKKKTLNRPKRNVFIQIGAKPLFAATREFFVNDYIEFAGGVNIFKDAISGLISREEVLKRNPDVILIATMGISGEDEMKIWQKYKTINAVKQNRIHIVDADRICSPTPVSFAEYLHEIVEILNPGTLK